MWEPYRQAVKSVLPQATIVIDKFHVTRMANQCLETVRKNLRQSLTPKSRRALMHDRFILLKRRKDLRPAELMILESWILNYPDLGKAYELKEMFYGIWNSYGLDGAKDAYDQWKKQIPPHLHTAFIPLLTAMTNWQKEIFAYFEHPVRLTNAYTESLNNLIRIMNRIGRGYSFEALRARILFTEGVHKKQRPQYSRRAFLDSGREIYHYMFGDATVGYGTNPHICNYGSDISTLIHYLEEGDIPPGSTR